MGRVADALQFQGDEADADDTEDIIAALNNDEEPPSQSDEVKCPRPRAPPSDRSAREYAGAHVDTIPKDDSDEKVAVSQWELYCWRGIAFRDFNLLEWSSVVQVIPKSEKKNDDEELDDIGEEDAVVEAIASEVVAVTSKVTKKLRGRRPNGRFEFEQQCPIAATHCQKILSRQRLPMHSGGSVPEMPDSLGDDDDKKAKKFSLYVMCVFSPATTS